MPALLYFITALALLFITSRYITPLSRAAAIVLLLLPLCFTSRALLTGRVYAPIEMAYIFHPLRDHAGAIGAPAVHDPNLFDIAFQMIPWREATRNALAHGEWPLLNRSIASGDVLAASMQPAVYSPFTWIACLVPAAESFTFTGSIAFFVALLGMFLFARELGASEEASIVAAIAFAFSASMTFQILWPIGFAWALLPLILLGVRRVDSQPAILLIALVLEITAGHPETLLHVTAIGGVYGLITFARRPRAIGKAILIGIAALLITAIASLPFIDATTQTVEPQIRQAYAQSPLRIVPADARAALLGDLFPFTRTKLMPRAEAGSIVLALALVGAWRSRKWFFIALGIAGVLAGANVWPVAQLLHKLPLFNVALNDRLAGVVPLCLGVLAAFAIDALSSEGRTSSSAQRGESRADARQGGRGRPPLLFYVMAALCVVIGIASRGNVNDPQRVIGEIFPLAIAAIIVLIAPRQTIALLALILAQRVISDGNLIPVNDKAIAYPRTPIFAPMLAKHDQPFRI